MMTTQLAFFVAFFAAAAEGLVAQQRVVVAGATGRVGRLVVSELLERNSTTVTAVVRDLDKAKEVLPAPSSRLEVVTADWTNRKSVKSVVDDADCVVWAATGFSDAASNVEKFKALLGLVTSTSFDVRALKLLSECVSDNCRDVCCSSAGVTRPTWTDATKERYSGASDIPIVRLNPLGILDVKRKAENELRACKQYTIVRPTGLNDDWPRGRVVFSQGDLAVGRISRADVAATLASVAVDVKADAVSGKTFECFALAGYPPPNSPESQLDRLRRDDQGPLSPDALDANYALMQQLVPGAILRPQDLAMGQTYEQLDKGETGRLGERGKEQVPASFANT